MRRLTQIITTVFFLGYSPLMPGTIASLAAVGLFISLRGDFNIILSVTAITVSLGFFFSEKAEELFKKKDAPCIVIDEVAGMLLSLIFLPQSKINGGVILGVFLVFRLFDVLKPYPIKSLQKLKGSFGVMLDDIVAAIYTSCVFQIFLRLTSCTAS